MFVRLPCGTQQQIVCKREYGRGNPVNLTDPQLSREQVMLEPVPGMEGVLQLTNKGINREFHATQADAAQVILTRIFINTGQKRRAVSCGSARVHFYLQYLVL